MNARGTARIDEPGNLRFGLWRVKGDDSVVDVVKSLTGIDATIFEVRDGRPTHQAQSIAQTASA